MTTGHFRQQKARLVEQRVQLFFFFKLSIYLSIYLSFYFYFLFVASCGFRCFLSSFLCYSCSVFLFETFIVLIE